MGKGFFHLYIPKFLKVPVDKRNNTSESPWGHRHAPQRQYLACPVLVYLVDKKTKVPRSPKEQPPHAPTGVQEGFPWTVFRNALLLAFFKKQKQHALQVMERLVQSSPCSDSRLQKDEPLYVLLIPACGLRPWPAMLCKLRSQKV